MSRSIKDKPFSKQQQWLIVIITSGYFYSTFVSELFFPLLPFFSKGLRIEETLTQYIMPFYFTGMMISQLLIGYFSTRHGLKSALKASVFIATLGTLFIALAPNFIYLLLSFLIQAFGVGAIDPISSNMTNVAFDKLRAHKVFVFTTLAYGVAAVMAPFSVTIFRSVLPVRSIYLILAILAAIYLLLLLAPLKAITEKRENSSFKSYLKKNFFLLTCFNHKNFGFFPSISLFFSLFMAAFFSLFTVVPFILANQFHRDLAHVVELFAVGCFFYFGGMLLSQSLSLYFKATTIIRFSLYLTLINVASLLLRSIVDLYGIWEVNVFFYFLAHFFLINLTLGILTPCTYALALSPFSMNEDYAASASSVMRFSVNALTALSGFVISLVKIDSSLAMSAVLTTILVFAALSFHRYIRAFSRVVGLK